MREVLNHRFFGVPFPFWDPVIFYNHFLHSRLGDFKLVWSPSLPPMIDQLLRVSTINQEIINDWYLMWPIFREFLSLGEKMDHLLDLENKQNNDLIFDKTHFYWFFKFYIWRSYELWGSFEVKKGCQNGIRTPKNLWFNNTSHYLSLLILYFDLRSSLVF